jgi:quercetin dioxygenase-like cupin family protein
MKVVHPNDVPEEKVPNDPLFTGLISKHTPITDKDSQFTVSFIHFPAGVRNKFHTHTSDQILIVTEGKGTIATDQEEQEISVGDFVYIPKGEKHHHGASAESRMTHISITSSDMKIEQLEQ